MLVKMIIYFFLICFVAYVAACQWFKSAIDASARNRNMEEVVPTKMDYTILTLIFVIIGGLSLWGAKSLHYWLTTPICLLIALAACWFASRKQPVAGCAIALIVMQALVELATFVAGANANLMFALFALIKVILIIVIVGFGFYVIGMSNRDEDNGTYRGKKDFNSEAAAVLDNFKKALAKEGAKEGIIFLILVVVALIILFKLVLPSV